MARSEPCIIVVHFFAWKKGLSNTQGINRLLQNLYINILILNLIRSKSLSMFVCLNSGLECLSNLEKVIILKARFCSIRRGFMLVWYVLPHTTRP